MNNINFIPCGGLMPRTGYGRMEVCLWRELARLGIRVHPLVDITPEGVGELPYWAIHYHAAKAAHTLITGRPILASLASDTRRWVFTMAESDRVSDKHVAAINRRCDGVIVCAPELVDIYRRSGVTVPVHFVPLGIDYGQIPPLLPRTEPTHTYLTYSLGDARKGAELAMFAFKSLFGDKPDYRLKVKIKKAKGTWLQGCRDAQIELVEGETSEFDWYTMLQQADAFIFPSRGEGFGLPPREAALVGTPVIATQALGMWDVDCWGFPVQVSGMDTHKLDGEGCNHPAGKWWEPDFDHLCEQLAWVDAHPVEARHKAAQGRDYLLQNFRWADVARRVVQIMEGAA